MIKKQGKPITGARVPQRRPFVLANQAETSSTLQRQVRLPDIPKQDSQLRVPAPSHPEFTANSDFAKDARKYGFQKVIRYDLAPIGGGAPSSKGVSSINSGYPTRRTQRVAGRISTNAGPSASASEMRRLRQTFPGVFGAKWRP